MRMVKQSATRDGAGIVCAAALLSLLAEYELQQSGDVVGVGIRRRRLGAACIDELPRLPGQR